MCMSVLYRSGRLDVSPVTFIPSEFILCGFQAVAGAFHQLKTIIYGVYVWQSLQEVGDGMLAEGRLRDLIRRLSCFGLSLLKLDIRQVTRQPNSHLLLARPACALSLHALFLYTCVVSLAVVNVV